jgi:putative hemolysin
VVLLALALVLILTGLLTMGEMALFSVRRERLEVAAESNDGRARVALQFLDDPPRFLTASGVLLTTLSILAGSLVQPGLTQPLGDWLLALGLAREAAPTVAYATAVAAVALCSLVFANLLPKQLGFVFAEPITLKGARPLGLCVALARPAAAIVEPVLRMLERVLRVPRAASSDVDERGLLLLMKDGLRTGSIDPNEYDIVRRAFRLSELRVEEFMTPRDQVEWIELDLVPSAAKQRVAASSRSWIVVSDDKLDDVVGVVQARAYLAASSPPSRDELLAMLRQPLRVPTGTRLTHALARLAESDCRILLVESPEHGLAGLVTANDLVCAVVGPLRALGQGNAAR